MTFNVDFAKFFNSVALIDDQLPTGEPAGDNYPLVEDYDLRPVQVWRAFRDRGIPISPIPFRNVTQVDSVVKQILATKLTILDWELVGKSPDAAMEIIRKVFETPTRGLRWIVVYTRETTSDLKSDLLNHLGTHGREDLKPLITQAKDNLAGTDPMAPLHLEGLFVTFMNKMDVEANKVFDQFTRTVSEEYGSVVLTVLSMSAELERQTPYVVQEFAKPFDLSLRLHALTSGLKDKDMAPFLYRLYADTVKERAINAAALPDFHGERLAGIRLVRQFHTSSPAKFQELISTLRSDPDLAKELVDWDWSAVLNQLITCTTAEALEAKFSPSQLGQYATGTTADDWSDRPLAEARLRSLKVTLEILSAFVPWQIQNPEAEIHSFLLDIQHQTVNFSKLLKYESGASGARIETGALYRHKVKNQYLMCITPYCDTAHPNKVNSLFKFLVGERSTPKAEEIEDHKRSYGRHGTFVPGRNTNQMDYVGWKFYHDEVHFIPPAPTSPVRSWVQSGHSLVVLGDNLHNWTSELTTLPERVQEALLSLVIEANDTNLTKSLLDIGLRGTGELDEATAGQVLTEWALSQPAPPGYRFVAKLKKEYVQQIMNEYVAYHSRAGVSELYMKEWPAPIIGAVHTLPAKLSLQEELSAYGLTEDLISQLEKHDLVEHVRAVISSGKSDAVTAATWLRDNAGQIRGQVTPANVAKLYLLKTEKKVNPEGVVRALKMMGESGDDCDDVVRRGKLEVVSDEYILKPILEEVFAEMPDDVPKSRHFGWIMTRIKDMELYLDAVVVRRLVEQRTKPDVS